MSVSPFLTLFLIAYVLVAGGIGVAVTRSRVRSRPLAFVAGAIGAVGAYALMRYPGSRLRDGRDIGPGWLRTALRVLYVGSASALALFGAAQLIVLASLAVDGAADRVLALYQEPSGWVWVLSRVFLVGCVLLWILCLYALAKNRSVPARGSWLANVALFNFFGAYWFLSEPAETGSATKHA